MVLLVAATLAGCRFDGLAFVQDRRLDFVAPQERELVTLPVTIEWEIEDFVVSPPSGEGDGYFGVFVDTEPQPPGEELSWFARDDDECQRRDDCPDREYYADRDIHTTAGTSFTVEQLDPPADDTGRELHEVTVVLLDRDSRRIGESAWTIEFEIEREER